MSEFRASEDALRRLYLGGRERNGLPSDVWSGKDFEGMEIREAEGESPFLRAFPSMRG